MEEGSWNPPGRSGGWRSRMFIAGLISTGVGVAIIVWPAIIKWAIASFFLLIGAFAILSSLLARGGGEGAPEVVVEVLGSRPAGSRDPSGTAED